MQTKTKNEQRNAIDRDELLTTNELARLWGISNQTVQRWRQYGVSNFPRPIFEDIALCLYAKTDIYNWLKSLGQSIKTNIPITKGKEQQ